MFEATLSTCRLSPSRASAKNPGSPAVPGIQNRSRIRARRLAASSSSAAASASSPRWRSTSASSRRARWAYPWTSTIAIGPSARLPSGNWTALSESFQLWFLSERDPVERYSSRPSPSGSPGPRIQPSAARAAGSRSRSAPVGAPHRRAVP